MTISLSSINLVALTFGEVVYANGNFNYFNGTKLIPINTGISAANAAIITLKAEVATLQTQMAALIKTPPVIPPDVNQYPLTMTPVIDPGASVTIGQGPDQIVLLLSQSPTDTAKSEIAIILDGVVIAAPLFVTSNGGNQIFTINGSWGGTSASHTIEIVGAGIGVQNLGVGAVSYDFVPYVYNGPATFRQDGTHVNSPSVWDNFNLSTTWTLPISVPPLPRPPVAAPPTSITATINGASTTGTLDQLCAATPANGALVLPSGTFIGTSPVVPACT